MPIPKESKAAFTLVELLVVIAIIGVLASLMMPSITTARDKARRANCTSNMRQIGAALLAYASDHDGYYPHSGASNISWDDRISGYDGRPALDPNSSSIKDGMKASALGYNEHGAYPVYQCPSHRDPDNLMLQGTKRIPRSYSLNEHDPTHFHKTSHMPNYCKGVCGSGEIGAEKDIDGKVWRLDSRSYLEIGRPSRTIILVEKNNIHDGRNFLGSTGKAVSNVASFRNHRAAGPAWNTVKGSHADGRLDNYLMADGSIKALDFAEVVRGPNGNILFAGGNWRETMWDAGTY